MSMAGFRSVQLVITRNQLRCITRPMSSIATESLEEDVKVHRFRTLENDPTCHNANHIGKYYTIPNNAKEKLFFSGGIPTCTSELIDAFQECSVLIRKPAIEAKSYLEQYNYDYPALRIVMYGHAGTGKTTSLMHLAHYAYKKKYLLLHIPWVSNWTKRPKEIVDSVTRPGRIDLPIESSIWLQHFKLQNIALLKELDLRTSKTYTWSAREVTEEGKPLMDVVQHGVNRGRHSSDCIAVLLKEIKLQSTSGKFKTLVIIDGVNAFYCKTNVRLPNKIVAKATDLTMVHAFEKMLKNDWNNAAVITTVDTIPQNRYESLTIACTPRALLGKEGFEVLDPFIPIKVENYTEKEIESVLDYYTDRKWILHPDALEESGRKQLKFLSGHNPFSLMKYCEPL